MTIKDDIFEILLSTIELELSLDQLFCIPQKDIISNLHLKYYTNISEEFYKTANSRQKTTTNDKFLTINNTDIYFIYNNNSYTLTCNPQNDLIINRNIFTCQKEKIPES